MQITRIWANEACEVEVLDRVSCLVISVESGIVPLIQLLWSTNEQLQSEAEELPSANLLV